VRNDRFSASVWRFATACWIALIFFSSTSLAGKWSEEAFSYLSTFLLAGVHPDSPGYGVVHLMADKGVHVSLFCVLAILLWKALRGTASRIPLILLWGGAIGSCSELLQTLYPDRDPAIRDVVINLFGVSIGIAVCRLGHRLQARRQASKTDSAWNQRLEHSPETPSSARR
jgi:VanZ family protein